MELRARTWFTAADARPAVASWPVTLFVMLASGFVLSELAAEHNLTKAIYAFVPEALTGWIGEESLGGWIEGIWTLGAVPLVLWVLVALVAGNRGVGRTSRYWRIVALPAAVVVSTGHMVKGLAKFVTWAGFLPLDLADPFNRVTSAGLGAETITAPASLLSFPVVACVGAILLGTSIWLSARETRLAGNGRDRRNSFAGAVLGAIYLSVVAVWMEG